MKRLLTLMLLLAAGAAPAQAQYWGPPSGGYYDDDGPPPPRYRGPPPDRGWDEPRGDWRRGPPSRGGGSMCYTSRGTCPTYQPLPVGAPCACEIPGFGRKRGAVVR
jgi:hypothetical protein